MLIFILKFFKLSHSELQVHTSIEFRLNFTTISIIQFPDLIFFVQSFEQTHPYSFASCPADL